MVMHVELLNPRKAIQVGNNNSNLKHGLPITLLSIQGPHTSNLKHGLAWRSSYYPAID